MNLALLSLPLEVCRLVACGRAYVAVMECVAAARSVGFQLGAKKLSSAAQHAAQ